MHMPDLPFRVLASRVIAVAVILFLVIIGCEYACWLWKAMTATIKSPAIVLTEEAHINLREGLLSALRVGFISVE